MKAFYIDLNHGMFGKRTYIIIYSAAILFMLLGAWMLYEDLQDSGMDNYNGSMYLFMGLSYLILGILHKKVFRRKFFLIDEQKIHYNLKFFGRTIRLQWKDIEAMKTKLFAAHFKLKNGETHTAELELLTDEEVKEIKTQLNHFYQSLHNKPVNS
jgi:hypothetical protein